jgi:2-polyprenyl-3-methyl-5-hydroxy-6-metoxy-1,4-benzoquinol methylase
LLLGIKLKETTTSYRGFRKSLIERLNIDHIKSEGYSFFFECTYQISNITKKLAEFPIYFDDRRSGTSKILKIEVMKGMIVLLKLFLMRIFNIKTKTIQIIYPETYKIIDCNICNLPYHVEIYPSASSTVQDKSMYKCTSTHHDSHDRIVKCLSCGTIFSNPQLAEDKVHEFYANVEDAAYLENLEGRFRTFQYNLNKIMKYLPASGKLLEVGSYYGAFLKIANDSGFDSIGIEPCSFAVDYSINHFGLKAIQGTLLDLPENLKDFDIIASWDVLEHLINPMKELKLMNTKLKKGGILVFSTLNIDNWYPKILGEKWPWLMNMHLYYFNENIIAEILRRSGFQVLYVQSYCHIISFDYFLSKLSQLGFPEMTSLRRIIARTPLKKIFIPFGFGDIKMYVCKKL